LRCILNNLEKYSDDIKHLVKHAFSDRSLKNLKVNSAGSVIINGMHISSIWFTTDDVSVDEFDFIYFAECNIENANILIHTDGFNYREIKKDKFNSMFRYEDPELEYDNFVTVEDITKMIFGNAILHNTTDKFYLYTNGKIEISHSQLVELNEDYACDYFYIKYSGGKDIWSDDVLRISLRKAIKAMTNIEYDLNDIQPENLQEIGKQVQAIIY
jgi:hypothetical protein